MLCERFDIFNAKTSRFIFKAILSVLQALLFCIHGWIFVGVRLSGKRKRQVLETLNQMNFVFCPTTVYLQHTNENHTPNTSLVNSSFSSIKRLTHPKLNNFVHHQNHSLAHCASWHFHPYIIVFIYLIASASIRRYTICVIGKAVKSQRLYLEVL